MSKLDQPIELKFSLFLEIYMNQLWTARMRFIKGIITEAEMKAEWRTGHYWLQEIKMYLDQSFYAEFVDEDFSAENWKNLQNYYSYEGEKPYKLVLYRGEILPIFNDDYGQQDYTVIRGEVYGGGAYNFFAIEDFCSSLDYILEKEFINSEEDWPEYYINPLEGFLKNTNY